MTSHKRRVGTIGPKKFVQKLKEENMMFQGLTQQDAHEFLNYTINEISDLLRRDDERAAEMSQVLMCAHSKCCCYIFIHLGFI